MDKYNIQWKNRIINNQPGISLKETGYYFIDHYGCWHKVKVIAITDSKTAKNKIDDEFYMIGEYPENY